MPLYSLKGEQNKFISSLGSYFNELALGDAGATPNSDQDTRHQHYSQAYGHYKCAIFHAISAAKGAKTTTEVASEQKKFRDWLIMNRYEIYANFQGMVDKLIESGCEDIEDIKNTIFLYDKDIEELKEKNSRTPTAFFVAINELDQARGVFEKKPDNLSVLKQYRNYFVSLITLLEDNIGFLEIWYESTVPQPPHIDATRLYLMSTEKMPKTLGFQHVPAIIRKEDGTFDVVVNKVNQVERKPAPSGLDQTYIQTFFDTHCRDGSIVLSLKDEMLKWIISECGHIYNRDYIQQHYEFIEKQGLDKIAPISKDWETFNDALALILHESKKKKLMTELIDYSIILYIDWKNKSRLDKIRVWLEDKLVKCRESIKNAVANVPSVATQLLLFMKELIKGGGAFLLTPFAYVIDKITNKTNNKTHLYDDLAPSRNNNAMQAISKHPWLAAGVVVMLAGGVVFPVLHIGGILVGTAGIVLDSISGLIAIGSALKIGYSYRSYEIDRISQPHLIDFAQDESEARMRAMFIQGEYTERRRRVLEITPNEREEEDESAAILREHREKKKAQKFSAAPGVLKSRSMVATTTIHCRSLESQPLLVPAEPVEVAKAHITNLFGSMSLEDHRRAQQDFQFGLEQIEKEYQKIAQNKLEIQGKISCSSKALENINPVIQSFQYKQKSMNDQRPKINAAYQYEDNDIQAILSARLQEFRVKNSRLFIKPIKILAAIDDIMDAQLEHRLRQESKNHQGSRICLIPCNLGNAHWVGIFLAFDVDGKVSQVHYIDSLKSQSIVPETFQKQLKNVYPRAYFEIKTLLQQSDYTSCGAYLIENLLTAAFGIQSAQDEETIRSLHLEALRQYNLDFYNTFNERQQNNRPTTVDLHEQLGYLDKLKNIWFSKQQINRILSIKQCLSNLPEKIRTSLLKAFEYKLAENDNHALHLNAIRMALKEALEIESKALSELVELLFEPSPPGTPLVVDKKFAVGYEEILAVTKSNLAPEQIKSLQQTLTEKIRQDEEFALKLQDELWSRNETLPP